MERRDGSQSQAMSSFEGLRAELCIDGSSSESVAIYSDCGDGKDAEVDYLNA